MEPDPWPEQIVSAEGPWPCLPMAAMRRHAVPAGLMLVGRLWIEGRRRSFFVIRSHLAMGQEYQTEIVASERVSKASESARVSARFSKMDFR